MSLLCKYVPSDLIAGTPRPLVILQTMQLFAANPCTFNDPFEVRPVFDQERHDHAAGTSEAFHGGILGIEHPLIRGRSIVGLATESAFGFGEQLHERFLIEIARKFRVLSLSARIPRAS